jgi:sulfatase maturation enzyme AslB (radical SAM superfamily)
MLGGRSPFPERIADHMSAASQSAGAAVRQSEHQQTGKFLDPLVTAGGQERAWVQLDSLQTLWFNTGTLCNITCEHCYIESSPTNDRLSYLSLSDVQGFLDEVEELSLPTHEIGFTGGEPFMNPDFTAMLDETLRRGFEALVLTNAMQPMQRPDFKSGLLELKREYGDRLTLRVSLDHYSPELHESERGAGSWPVAMDGLRWLSSQGFRISVAGRTRWNEHPIETRRGYAKLFEAEQVSVDAGDPVELVLFPEMDESADVPEITVGCWEILDRQPEEMMCGWSRMVVKRKGQDRPTVLACTLLPYDARFELGSTLADSETVVRLNHPHCATFCVLGGGACSAAG